MTSAVRWSGIQDSGSRAAASIRVIAVRSMSIWRGLSVTYSRLILWGLQHGLASTKRSRSNGCGTTWPVSDGPIPVRYDRGAELVKSSQARTLCHSDGMIAPGQEARFESAAADGGGVAVRQDLEVVTELWG